VAANPLDLHIEEPTGLYSGGAVNNLALSYRQVGRLEEALEMREKLGAAPPKRWMR
jgi:hypothetical protein